MGTNLKTFDVAVIGAGVFGSWTALRIARRSSGRVVLRDGYGPANARPSSGCESRLIRAGYGSDELYARWAVRFLDLWTELFAANGVDLFHRSGVLWLAREGDTYVRRTAATLTKLGIAAERLDHEQLRLRYPQFNLEGIGWGLLELQHGVLMGRRAVRAVVAAAVAEGVTYLQASVNTPTGERLLRTLQTSDG